MHTANRLEKLYEIQKLLEAAQNELSAANDIRHKGMIAMRLEDSARNILKHVETLINSLNTGW